MRLPEDLSKIYTVLKEVGVSVLTSGIPTSYELINMRKILVPIIIDVIHQRRFGLSLLNRLI